MSLFGYRPAFSLCASTEEQGHEAGERQSETANQGSVGSGGGARNGGFERGPADPGSRDSGPESSWVRQGHGALGAGQHPGPQAGAARERKNHPSLSRGGGEDL